jgi:hypothetical protein
MRMHPEHLALLSIFNKDGYPFFGIDAVEGEIDEGKICRPGKSWS